VTNAVKQLANEGFVRVRPHQEAVVAPLDPKEIREIYVMRAALESLALEEAATRVTEDDLVDVRALNDDLRKEAGSPRSTIENARAVDKAFHERLRDIAKMPYLSQTLQNYADQCEYYRVCLLDQHHFAPPTAERHELIIEALERRDAVQLRAHMTTHVLQGMDLILNALKGS
jgi:DNA-binding GntR family transcriptional regulator